MRPQYVNVAAGGTQIVPLDLNKNSFNVSVQAPAGITVEHTVDQIYDKNVVPTWNAAPAAVNGVVNYQLPVTAVRLTSTGAAGTAVVLQNGIQ